MNEGIKALCIGSSLLELTCSINEEIKENSIMRLENKIECGGGHAGNIAYLLGKWGIETYIASMMGADDAANKIKKEYEAINIRTDYIETSYDKQTSQMIVLVNEKSKNKTIFEIANNAFLKKYSFGIEPSIIIVDGNDFNASVAAFDKYPKALSFLTVTRSNNEILELCKYVKYIIFNKSMAETYAGITINYDDSSTIVNIYNKLKQKFNKAEIVITLGERGSVYAINGQVKIMPTIKMDIQDTNGAGDVYVGAFAYAMGKEFGLEKAVAYATIAGAMSTTKMTSRKSIPALMEVSNYYDSKFGAQNNPNNMANNNGNVNNVPNNNPQSSSTQENASVTPGNVPNPNVQNPVASGSVPNNNPSPETGNSGTTGPIVNSNPNGSPIPPIAENNVPSSEVPGTNAN